MRIDEMPIAIQPTSTLSGITISTIPTIPAFPTFRRPGLRH
jgi:hypothetical protein